jgi:hypothetical protein
MIGLAKGMIGAIIEALSQEFVETRKPELATAISYLRISLDALEKLRY